MAKPTVQQVLDSARTALGDDAVAGGEVFLNAKLLPSYKKAYRVWWQAMMALGNPRVRRDVYHVVPVNTSVLDPATAGILDFGEPLFFEQRGGLTEKAITNAVLSPVTAEVSITVAGHGRATGDIATVNGVGGVEGADGIWGLTVADPNTLRLNGSRGTGVYTAGGVLVYSNEAFSPVGWEWLGDVFRFSPSATPRQVKITYYASGAPPTTFSASIGVDDCEDLLGTLTAAYACATRNPQLSDRLLVDALGQYKSVERPGGLMWAFLNTSVRAMQAVIPPTERRRLPFRDSRRLEDF
jgi:hypothetical protein